jgi:hypothetical protein
MSDARVANPSGAAAWLSLAATPVFAFMALWTSTHGAGAADILCSAAHGAAPFGGMVPMYVLMSVFHAAPWVKLAGCITKAA